jgi:hypothetical protein
LRTELFDLHPLSNITTVIILIKTRLAENFVFYEEEMKCLGNCEGKNL